VSERLAFGAASHWQALALIAAGAAFHRDGRAKAARQVFGSRLAGWSDETGRLVAVLGLYPLAAGAECWLAGDAARARPHLLQIARQARLTLAAAAQDGVVPIVAHVRAGWLPGARLAAMTGFAAPASLGAAEPVATFVWSG